MGLDGMCRLELHKLAIHKDKLLNIARIGLPAGLQGAIFSYLQRADPVLGKLFRSHRHGWKHSCRKPGGLCIYVHELCIPDKLELHQPEHGSRNRQRMKKILGICLILVSVVGLVLGNGFVFFGQQLLGIYSSDPEVIQYGLNRMHLICAPYFLCGLMDVMVGSMRGMGYSFLPMIVSLIGACGLRVVWISQYFNGIAPCLRCICLIRSPGRSRRWHIWLAGMW